LISELSESCALTRFLTHDPEQENKGFLLGMDARSSCGATAVWMWGSEQPALSLMS